MDSERTISAQDRGSHGLRRSKAARVFKESKTNSNDANSDFPLALAPIMETRTAHRLLRVWLESPWNSYYFIRRIHAPEQGILAHHKSSYFNLAVIKDFSPSGTYQTLQALNDILHPNIANIYEVYLYDDKLCIAAEHLDVSLIELDFQSFALQEWEIATIIKEVLKAAVYLLSKGLTCRELSMSSIRLSMKGEVKLVLNPWHYEEDINCKDPKYSHALLDFPLLAEVAEEMMLPRYHLTENEAWSREALSFLSCSLSESLESLMKHSFLELAKAPSRLAPRIIFAVETLRGRADEAGENMEEGSGRSTPRT